MPTTHSKDVVVEHSAGVVVVRKNRKKYDILLTSEMKDRKTRYGNEIFFRTDIPKGEIDEGETIEEAACRELKEETGYIIDPLSLDTDKVITTIVLHKHRGNDKIIDYFVVDESKIQDWDEEAMHEDVIWSDFIPLNKLAYEIPYLKRPDLNGNIFMKSLREMIKTLY